MGTTFAGASMYWLGSDTPDLADNVAEVLANNSELTTATLYELIRSDARKKTSGPKWLTIFEISDETSAARFVEREITRRGKSHDDAPQAVPWELCWRKVGEVGNTDVLPHCISIVGMDPSPDADEHGIAEFNDFYTNIHAPEVMAFRNGARATRYELLHEFHHPAPHCPRFLCIYEGNAERTAEIEREAADPIANPHTKPSFHAQGPTSYDGRSTFWQLAYRRI